MYESFQKYVRHKRKANLANHESKMVANIKYLNEPPLFYDRFLF